MNAPTVVRRSRISPSSGAPLPRAWSPPPRSGQAGGLVLCMGRTSLRECEPALPRRGKSGNAGQRWGRSYERSLFYYCTQQPHYPL